MTQTEIPMPTDQQIVDAVNAQRDTVVQMLAELVSHPSLLGQEQSAQDYMCGVFAGMGLQVNQFQIDEDKIRQHPGYSPSIVSYEGRTNVVGVHTPAGHTKGRSLILNGHIDVVPVGFERMWTSPPFSARVEGDRLYGRGANDMKAGIVAYTMAMRVLQRMGYEPAATVYLQSVIEEECTGNGALACLVEGYTADAALIPEPSQENVMCAQLGVLWITIETFGLPVHASHAHTGVAAIEFAQYLVGELRTLERKWNEAGNRHPMYCRHDHPINFNLGKIQGGEWTSSVPTHARVDLRLGYYPGRKAADVKREVEAFLKEAHARHPQAASANYEVKYEGFQGDGLVVDMEEPVIKVLMACHEQLNKAKPGTHALAATTDVKFFHLYGNIPSTCYGPQGGAIHGIDEWVSIESIQRVTAVYALFIARWCGLNPLPGRIV